jgi:pimeloyl-ACP methyl ester carboxylesterase
MSSMHMRTRWKTRGSGKAALATSLLVATLVGCSSITVRRAQPAGPVEEELSPPSLQTLQQTALDGLYRSEPDAAFLRLQQLAREDPQPDRLLALAEMAYLGAIQEERWADRTALAMYYLSAGYTYHFLFPGPAPETGSASPVALDARAQQAWDLYNASLEKLLRAAQRLGHLDPGATGRLRAVTGGLQLALVPRGFLWKPEELGPLRFCSDYKVEGLSALHRTSGLGVPLIGSRLGSAPAPVDFFYPRGLNFPVTAFLRFDGPVAGLSAEHQLATLELYNPLALQTVDVGGRPLPLETDLTTPLAYYFSHTEFNDIPLEGFLRPEKIQRRSGIYLFEPYEPGKIPVVLVHGLVSSPVTWAPLFNDLRADPVLRRRFQFWFYLYPTSEPYLATAADLRETLNRLRIDLDPDHKDAALDRLVLVGHSMGGLLCKLLTVDSGNDFWRLVSPEPFDRLTVRPDSRAELQRIFYFERQPWARRVIFLGTPHHGSKLSPSLPGKIADEFVHLPGRLLRVAQDVTHEDPRAWPSLRDGGLPTSVDWLAPGAPALELLASRTAPAGVRYHSVIGVEPCNPYWLGAVLPGAETDGKSDGIVSYASAHLDGVASELTVPADHFHVHSHPLSVAEVRRILQEHAQSE